MFNKKMFDFGNIYRISSVRQKINFSYFKSGFIVGFISALLILFIISLFILYP